MKIFFSVSILYLLFAQLSWAVSTNFDHIEAEKAMEERKRDLKTNTPLNEAEIFFLKRLLSSATLRESESIVRDLGQNRLKLSNDVYEIDPLAKAMRDSAMQKVDKTMRRSGGLDVRSIQDLVGTRKIRESRALRKNNGDGKEKGGDKQSKGKASEKGAFHEQSPLQKIEAKKAVSKEQVEVKQGRTREKTVTQSAKVIKPVSTTKQVSKRAPKGMEDVIANALELDGLQGRMSGASSEPSDIEIVSTTRSAGYRSGNKGNRNSYYEYGNNGHRNGYRNQNRNPNSYYNYGNNQNRPVVDDVFRPQPQQNFAPPPRQKAEIPTKVSMVLEAFQDSRMIQPPVLSGQSFLSPGTQYLFVNEPLYEVVFDIPPNMNSNRAVYLVNERNRIATVSGECIRTDPKVEYVGKAYCQFDYNFIDSHGNIEASLTASGPISKGDIDTLSITGGSGIFRRTVGTVILESGALKRGTPPVFVPDDTEDLPTSWLVKMFVFLDSVDLEVARSS